MRSTTSRRQFLSDNFSAATSFAAGAALGSLGQRFAMGESSQPSQLVDAVDETTGISLLRLPEGFRYRSFGWAGDPMDDGFKTPKAHDGMGAVAIDGNQLTLVRNHEVSEDGKSMPIVGEATYDARARGGCTSLTFDLESGQWLGSRTALSGTSRNCAGGVTPWNTWLTAEETVLGPGDRDKYKLNTKRTFQKTHGWVFEVPADGVGNPVPIKSMGRFVHEAVAVDRNSGIVYLTEDRGTAGFYRFTPNENGNLHAGGVLEMAEVVGTPDLRGGFVDGTSMDVRWHKIDDPELVGTPEDSPCDELGVFKQGQAKGGSMFSRLEGCWYGDGQIYFDATSGGAARAGQIWQFDPETQKLTLLFESPSKPVLNMPDNLCVSPRGGIVLCEDNDYGANEFPQRMFGLSQDGKLRLLAENNIRLSGEKNGIHGDFRTKEWAGATFSPDGKWLFVNAQTPGITFAITGPWESTLV